jgi:hypothetical protein
LHFSRALKCKTQEITSSDHFIIRWFANRFSAITTRTSARVTTSLLTGISVTFTIDGRDITIRIATALLMHNIRVMCYILILNVTFILIDSILEIAFSLSNVYLMTSFTFYSINFVFHIVFDNIFLVIKYYIKIIA